MVRFGVLGLGFMGRTHLATLARHAEAVVAAVHDPEPDRLLGPLGPGGGNLDTGWRTWDASKVRRCKSAEEIFEDPDIDAVVVAVPSYLHAELSCAASMAGKHVFCEKPMALTVQDCDRMISCARKAERVLMIGHCIRFWPEYAAAAEAVRSGEHGKLRMLLMSRRGAVPSFGARGWFTDHLKSGGALLDLHIHDVDYALFVLGKPQAVQARGEIGPSGGLDQVVTWLDYGPDGPIVQLEAAWMPGAGVPFVMDFRMYFEHASLVYSSDAAQPLKLYGDAARDLEVGAASAYGVEMDHFIKCLRVGMASNVIPPESSRLAVALALAAGRSVRTGQAVVID